MVSDAVLGALVGGGAAVLGSAVVALVNYLQKNKRLEADRYRRHAEFVMDRKIDALSEIHRELIRTYDALGEGLRNPSGYTWARVEEEVLPGIESLEHAISVGSIFLDDDQETVLRQAVEEYHDTADEIVLLESGSQVHLNDLFQTTDRAKETLAAEVDGLVSEFERSGGRNRTTRHGRGTSDWLPPQYRDGERRRLARQKDRLRDVLRLNRDGGVEFIHEPIGVEGKALFWLVGRRYAHEGGLLSDPSVSKEELRTTVFFDSSPATSIFLHEAERYLTKVGDDRYTVAAEDLSEAIDWAMGHVREQDDDESE